AWLPLAAGATALAARLLRADLGERAASFGVSAIHAGGFALASALGGLMVGRFGGQAGLKEATVSGFLAASIAWVIDIGAAPLGLLPAVSVLVVLASVGAGGAGAGGALGLKLRAKSGLTPPDERRPNSKIPSKSRVY